MKARQDTRALAEKRRAQARIDGWEYVDERKVSFKLQETSKANSFTSLNVSRRASLTDIFFQILPISFIQSILNKKGLNTKKRDILIYLAVRIRIQARQEKFLKKSPTKKPQRTAFEETLAFFKKNKFPTEIGFFLFFFKVFNFN